MPSPRIAFLIPNLHGGGTQRAQLLIARGAVELGETVDLVVCRRVGAFANDVPEGVRLIDLQGKTDWSPLKPLVQYLKTERPRVLFSALNQGNLLSLLAARKAGGGIKVVMAVQNHLGAKWSHQFTPTAGFRKFLFRWMYSRADRVVAVSESLKQYLEHDLRIPPRLLEAIPNPVDIDRVKMLARQPLDHPWINTPRTVPVAIAVGRLDYQKGFASLLEAVRLVLLERPLRLLVLGEGPRRGCLEATIRKLGLEQQIQLVGFQSNVYAWMSRADLFVLSSRWEGFPLVLLEARALGLPVVAANCESGPREISESIGGIDLVSPGDPCALARGILRFLRSKSKQSAGPPDMREFDPNVISRRYLSSVLR